MSLKKVLLAKQSFMARILITTKGSSGDVFPCIAVGNALRARGHEVRFAVTSQWATVLQQQNFPIIQLPDEQEAFPGVATSALRILVPMLRYTQPLEQAVARLRRQADALSAACNNIDLMITTSGQTTAPTAAERTHTPWITFALTPLVIPSAYFSPTPLPIKPPRWFQSNANRFSWAIGMTMLRITADRPVNLLRQSYGLPPQKDILATGSLSRRLTSVALSPAFFPRPPDWASYIQLTGFCFWDGADTWEMPVSLKEFFNTTTPIIAVSSGSMAPELFDTFTHFYCTSLSAIRRIGARALVIGAAPGVLPDPLPQDVYALPFAPFSHVYPQCTAVIHHGGVGSVAQTLRAGKPMLVVPWGFDQFLIGQQVADCGAGQWIARKSHTVEHTSGILTTLLHDHQYTAQAQRLATHIAEENGVATFCNRVEAVLTETRRSDV
jgi:UDP:flavonoid glycosyltransferase YjiC (YdhE family)